MDELFGLPTGRLTLALLAVFVVGALILIALAASDRISFRMALRNLPRRRTQSVLIVAGLMLATALFSAAFTTGDTLTNSLRAQALEGIGRVNVVVKAKQPETEGAAFGPGARVAQPPEAREEYFDASLAGEIRNRLSDVEDVSGVAPLARETVPVTSPRTNLSEPAVDVLGVGSMEGFDELVTASGGTLYVGDLARDEVYVSRETADSLGVGAGDKVEAALLRPVAQAGGVTSPERQSGRGARAAQEPPGRAQTGDLPSRLQGQAGPPRMPEDAPPGPARAEKTRATETLREQSPPKLKVAGVYDSGANPASETSMVMPLEELQKLVGEEGKVNEVLVTHQGPALEGGRYTEKTVDEIRPVLTAKGLQADPVKKDAIDGADTQGEIFSTLFVLFGQFSVAAGMLLIFLIFVMLAAERKHELGIARAVGMRRAALVRAFTFEGALYALLAAAIGSVAGVGIGWIMVRLLGGGFAGDEGEDLRIAFSASPENVVLAFCLGMVLTFAVVLISSWRVSRLNVVRAIRDIPEPDKKGRTTLGVIVAVLTPIVGAVSIWQGFATQMTALYLGGLSLLLIGLALLARVLGAPDRVAFTASGLFLLALWLIPVSITTPAGMARGPEMFFVSGIALVVAGVWLVVFNADVVLWMVVGAFGRIKGLPPVLKTAVKYPTQSLFRTGMTLAMFMLVVFTFTAMNFVQAGMGVAFGDAEGISGGYEIRADAGYADPVPNMDAALGDEKGLKGDISSVGQVSEVPAEVKQGDTDREPESVFVQGVDRSYSESVSYGFQSTARGYGSAREVWRALQKGDAAVISSDLAPERNASTFGPAVEPPVKLTGFYSDDERLPDDLYLRVKDPDSGKAKELRVIGVLESSASFAGQIVTSHKMLEELNGGPLPPQTYYFDLRGDADAAATARKLEKDFAENGLQTQVTAEVIRDSDATRRVIFLLLRGFMSLGIVVGICALGVISARSVVERRQQIGMMRALGFQKGQVRLAFLIESSFIALLGLGVGVGLGLGFSGTLIANISEGFPGMEYRIPWSALGLVIVAGYAASLLTTYLPARRASKVYPAEALRYE